MVLRYTDRPSKNEEIHSQIFTLTYKKKFFNYILKMNTYRNPPPLLQIQDQSWVVWYQLQVSFTFIEIYTANKNILLWPLFKNFLDEALSIIFDSFLSFTVREVLDTFNIPMLKVKIEKSIMIDKCFIREIYTILQDLRFVQAHWILNGSNDTCVHTHTKKKKKKKKNTN